MRIEGSHEVVELVPGGRSADSVPYWDSDGVPPRFAESRFAESRFAEWWRLAPLQEWLERGRNRLIRSPAGRSIMAAVERIPQRTRVVIALLAIAATGFIALGVGAGFVLRDYVVGRAEAQLNETAEQLQPALYSWRYYDVIRPLPDGVVAQRRDLDGDIREFGGFGDNFSSSAGPDFPVQLPAASDRSFTVPDREGDGRWLARVTTSPDAEYSLVVATEIGAGYAAVGRMTEATLVIGGLAVAAMALVGFRAVRAAGTPLAEIERTVEAAVAGDLSRRVPEREDDGEPGQVARAVNTLLEQIDDVRRAEERTRLTLDEASRVMRQRLNVIQGFTAFYRERPEHDPERMARLINRVGDEATRIEIAINDLVSDMLQARNGNSGRTG